MKHPFAPDKILAHKTRVSQWLKRGVSRPITFELDVTNRCNSNCPACFGFYPALDSSRMKLSDIQSVLSQIRAAGGKAVTFTGGGEPTVHPDLAQALRFARACGLDTALITNGLRLDSGLAAAVLETCIWTRISLDAASPAVFKATHGLGAAAWKRTLANITALTRLKRKTGSACTIGIGFLTSPDTAHDIVPFAALGRTLGVDYAQYRPFLRLHGGKDPDYSSARVAAAITGAEKTYATTDYRILNSAHKYGLIARGELARNYGKCYGHNFAAVICADMKMYVCCHMRGISSYSIGDLKKNSLAEIWTSAKRAKTITFINLKRCPPLCRCDSFNRILWMLKNGTRPALKWPESGPGWQHRNFI
ncbi:MAG: hypothetical protein A2234_08205 [Elusimicrobia bacterium RIFOXYA2_FULL_58_8]|nr:MAG: hypothetical protein A2285_01340 [Elusimicrobia bacterium RIFOXYA12_FULL_57_11]OGS17058.1 MAG: hypothetical protein A2234_08205 [Elusimicrobia bacterium RIFOXYA2_FULL_58_8]